MVWVEDRLRFPKLESCLEDQCDDSQGEHESCNSKHDDSGLRRSKARFAPETPLLLACIALPSKGQLTEGRRPKLRRLQYKRLR